MPTRADIEAATPKCPIRTTNTAPRCGRPLRWDDRHQQWKCVRHGTVLLGATLVARQAA